MDKSTDPFDLDSDIGSIIDNGESNKNPFIELAKIRPDPTQPREKFTEKELQELADSIDSVGMINPIIVLNDPENPGNYIIGSGERRFRAHQLLGRPTIECKIVENFTRAAQMIENVQRMDLSPPEITNYLMSEAAEGKTDKQIGKELGKSPAWVSMYKAFGKMPTALREAYDNERITDIMAIYDLTVMEKKTPGILARILAENDIITRAVLQTYKSKPQPEEKYPENELADTTATAPAAKNIGNQANTTDTTAEPGETPDQDGDDQTTTSKKGHLKILVRVDTLKGPKKGYILLKPTTGKTKIWVFIDKREVEVPVKNVSIDSTTNE